MSSKPTKTADVRAGLWAEELRVLRTNLLLQLEEQSGNSVLVTSAVRGEGKSTTCANLALVTAEAGLDVCVLDADLRLPRQHEILAAGSPQGGDVRAILKSGHADLRTSAAKVTEHLWLVHAGDFRPPNPSEVVSSQGFADLLAKAEAEFDIVFVDSPPVSAVTDPMVLCRRTASTLVVVAQGKAPKRVLARALHDLNFAGATVAGIALNRASRGFLVGSGRGVEYGHGYYVASSPV